MQLFRFNSIVRTLIAVVAIALVSATSAQASSVSGSEAISFASISMNTNNVTTATSFTFGGLTTAEPSTGDFATYVPTGTSTGSGLLATPAYTFSFGSAGFGTFTATGENYDTSFGHFRAIELVGTFSGGTLFPSGLRGSTPVILDISLNQAGGAGHAVSGSLSFVTTAVPEPTSVAMVGLGLCGLISYRRLRRKAA